MSFSKQDRWCTHPQWRCEPLDAQVKFGVGTQQQRSCSKAHHVVAVLVHTSFFLAHVDSSPWVAIPGAPTNIMDGILCETSSTASGCVLSFIIEWLLNQDRIPPSRHCSTRSCTRIRRVRLTVVGTPVVTGDAVSKQFFSEIIRSTPAHRLVMVLCVNLA